MTPGANGTTGRFHLDTWAFAVVAIPVIGAFATPMSAIDLAYHVRIGDLILAGRSIPASDPLTLTAGGQAWLDQQWGAQVLFAAVFAVGGWLALALFRAAVIGLLFGLVFDTCRRAGAGSRLAGVLTLASLLVAIPALPLRPQLPGMLCFALIGWLLVRREAHARALWTIPVLVVPWANLHGSFFLGPAVVGVAWIADVVAQRPGTLRLGVLTVASAVATAVTPFGPGVWGYALSLSSNPTLRRLIAEWQMPTLATYPGIALYTSLLLLLLAVVAARRRGILVVRPGVDWPVLAWLAGLALLAASVTRGGAWWALGAPPALALLAARFSERFSQASELGAPPAVRSQSGVLEQAAARLDAVLRRAEHPSRRLSRGALTLTVAAAVVAFPGWRTGDPLTHPGPLLTEAPATLSTALRSAGLAGRRTFVAQDEASWFEWADPGTLVFVDSRIELFPDATWNDYFEVLAGAPGWQAVLDRWRVAVLVVEPNRQPALAAAAAASTAWHRAADTPDGLVYVRAGG